MAIHLFNANFWHLQMSRKEMVGNFFLTLQSKCLYKELCNKKQELKCSQK